LGKSYKLQSICFAVVKISFDDILDNLLGGTWFNHQSPND